TPLTCGSQASVTMATFISRSSCRNLLRRCDSLAPRHLLLPVKNLHPPVAVLDQRRAAFDPVAVAVLFEAGRLAHLRRIAMAADDAVDASLRGRPGNDLLVTRDELDRVLDLVLGRLGERPVG